MTRSQSVNDHVHWVSLRAADAPDCTLPHSWVRRHPSPALDKRRRKQRSLTVVSLRFTHFLDADRQVSGCVVRLERNHERIRLVGGVVGAVTLE